jgi:deazaflavin-dependent oxidoreductase (nitroreductase family)
MAFPAWLARFNKVVTNPVLAPLAARAPYFGVVIHRGRVSGRVYRTPVNAFERDGDFIFAMTYGPDRDWVKNVLGQGRFSLLHRGKRRELVGPRLSRMQEPPEVIPGPARAILRRANVHTFMLARQPEATSDPHRSDDPPRD